MKPIVLLIVTMVAAAAGCAVPMADEAPVAASTAALTLEECEDNRASCFQENPFFGLFTCPVQYAQCVATAEDGIPAQVTAAISDAGECASEGRSCRRGAEAPSELLVCTTEQAQCVAAIVDANLPRIVTGTAECVDAAISCIRATETPGELRGCGETFEDCAVDQALDVLPPEVGAIAEDVRNCRFLLGECTDDADSPAALAQCAQDHVACIAGSLDVNLPDPPVAEGLQCAETAATCTLEARSLSDLRECGGGLLECTGDLVEQELTCEQQWTACLAGNPFNFFGCASELANCRD